MDFQRKALILLGAVIAVQIVDSGLHIAINEVELLRIVSNAVLVAGVSMGVFFVQTWRSAVWGGAIAYLVLNLGFVALFGPENPATGVNRAPLFAFMALSLWLTYRLGRLQGHAEPAQPG